MTRSASTSTELPSGATKRAACVVLEDGVARKVELGERLDAEEAGAVGGNADAGMLFEHDHVVPALRQLPRRHQPRRARADDDRRHANAGLKTCDRELPMCHAR